MASEKKDPAFLFYVTAWLQSETVRSMTLEQRGAFVELLSFSWLHGSIPADETKLCAMLGVTPAKFRKIWSSLSPCWSPAPGDDARLINDRQEHERTERKRKAEEARAKGRLGGQQTAKQKGQQKPSRLPSKTQAEGVAGAKPSTSTSTTSTPTPPPSGQAAGAKQEASRAEAEPVAETQAESDPVLQLQLALAKTTLRSKMPGFDRSRELTKIAKALIPTGLTPEDVVELDKLDAKKAKKDRGSLLNTWLKDNAWRSVLDEQRSKAKEGKLRSVKPSGDGNVLDGIYGGETPKTAASVLEGILPPKAEGA
tara:strand:+ start:1617 stop:2549 length:933 start_codon:yes stop_codon:yes gene_type:complete